MSEPFLAGLIVEGRRCVVFGGNAEALEKTRRLCAAGGKVTVIATKVLPPLEELAREKVIRWLPRASRDKDTNGAFLVVSVDRDPARAAALYASARGKPGFLLCCVDQPKYCTFTNLALVRRGALQIGIATSGVAPILAAKIRAALESQLGNDLSAFVSRLAALRKATPAVQ